MASKRQIGVLLNGSRIRTHGTQLHRKWYSSQTGSPAAVRILEVGPRDGLQNIETVVPTATKIEFIRRLSETGLQNIETTSFVSPKWIPQLADAGQVMQEVLPIGKRKGISMPVLAPNMKGLENASRSGVEEVVIFASCTEGFSQMNQNRPIAEVIAGAKAVADEAHKRKIRVRGVVSCIFSDPYTGATTLEQVEDTVKKLLALGCYEIGLGDTLGVGTPFKTQKLLERLLRDIPENKLAVHFHDTYGQGLAHAIAAYQMGIRSFDSAVAGLGGCPYAKGAQGNLASEDLIYAFEESGISTGVDLHKLIQVGQWVSEQVGVPNRSRTGTALLAKSTTNLDLEKAKADFKKKREGGGAPTSNNSAPSSVLSHREWKTIHACPEYRFSRSDNAVRITLTRGAKGNNMTLAMLTGLTKLFRELAHDRSVFHIVLDAEGKFFCTGMDLSTGTDRTSVEADGTDYYAHAAGLFTAIAEAQQTTIALIQGPSYAGGVGMGFVCDIRLATEASRWTLSEIKLGLAPAIISRYLAREWGIPFLRQAMLTGREVHVDELYRIGAVHGVAKDGQGLTALLDETLDRLQYAAPQAGAACKQLLNLAWKDPGSAKQDEFIAKEYHAMMQPGSEGEYGIRKFQEKVRKVQWRDFWTPEKIASSTQA
ncbi:hypothetical protein CERZMDRAFT_46447 [Cercospora zeae-maydis SCOH1-5]|uniref:hydroxymethylglutaryl-CoA lyase n=1 Tax=Cercospora zeae-maydis SCOH1-5 TaxID=717836 RepID=A0A6A6F8V8_9PEZI|nr:hypothetical protein CERZMDRAFT_46447 [Cercospora zeae-maydis SCOH1-5]